MGHRHLLRKTFRDHRRVSACGVLHAPMIKLDTKLHRHPVMAKLALRHLHHIPHTFHPSRHHHTEAIKELTHEKPKSRGVGKQREYKQSLQFSLMKILS
jgi:hypothetical protein